MNIAGFPRINREFKNAIRKTEIHYPGLASKLLVVVTADAGMTGRAFGYYDEQQRLVALSPRLEAEPAERIQGIIFHELGHAAAHLHGALGRSGMGEEKKADRIASRVIDRPLRYDSWDVQTTGPGRMVRPAYLHE